jgi:hypothetical protein
VVLSRIVSVLGVTLGLLLLLPATAAHAQRAETSEALDRLRDVLEPVVQDGVLAGVSPILVVSARPAFESTRSWFPTAAVVALGDAVGRANLRACEACMNPRATMRDGAFVYAAGTLSLAEIVAIDSDMRGAAAPAMAAAWIDETDGGIAIRIISLSTGRILYAENLDGQLRARERTARTIRFTDDQERRLRGESLTHVAIDIGLLPGQHISLDVLDQFGDKNLDLAGISVSAIDPILGVGGAYYRVIPEAFNLTLGLQALVAIPTAAGNALGLEGELIDPLLTGVLVARWPIPNSGFGVLATASTNGTLTIGVSLLNVSFLPVLP